MKICNRCFIPQPEENYSYKKKSEGIHNDYCKACHKLYVKKHYEANKDAYKKRARISNKKIIDNNTIFINQYKENKGCIICSETEPVCLDFHHTNDDKEFNVSQMKHVSQERILEEISKCQVLCANCHRKVHAGIVECPKSDSN